MLYYERFVFMGCQRHAGRGSWALTHRCTGPSEAHMLFAKAISEFKGLLMAFDVVIIYIYLVTIEDLWTNLRVSEFCVTLPKDK